MGIETVLGDGPPDSVPSLSWAGDRGKRWAFGNQQVVRSRGSLRRGPQAKLSINGYWAATGSARSNRELSRSRKTMQFIAIRIQQ